MTRFMISNQIKKAVQKGGLLSRESYTTSERNVDLEIRPVIVLEF